MSVIYFSLLQAFPIILYNYKHNLSRVNKLVCSQLIDRTTPNCTNQSVVSYKKYQSFVFKFAHQIEKIQVFHQR